MIVEDSAEILALLTAMPAQIARLAKGCDDAQLHRQPAPDAWSARDVVAHLRACADVWGRSLERMLDEDHPTMRYVSPRGWIRRTDFLERSFAESVRLFSEARKRLVGRLGAIAPEAWHRGATFTGTTLGRAATVLTYASRIARHEQGHLLQIQRTLEGSGRNVGAS